jgi:hypothetical protein
LQFRVIKNRRNLIVGNVDDHELAIRAAGRDSIERFIHVSGFLFLLFGVMAVVFRIVQFFVLGDPPLEQLVLTRPFLALQGIPSLVVAVFYLLGASALYLRIADRTGWVGLVVYYVAFSAMAISTGAMWTYTFTAPALAREAPFLLTSSTSGIVRAVVASLFLGQVGWLLMAVIALWAKEIPQWASLVAVGSIVLVVLMTPFAQTQLLRLIYNVLLGAGPLAIGFVLWKGQRDGMSDPVSRRPV